jgi:hypothetical protein
MNKQYWGKKKERRREHQIDLCVYQIAACHKFVKECEEDGRDPSHHLGRLKYWMDKKNALESEPG